MRSWIRHRRRLAGWQHTIMTMTIRGSQIPLRYYAAVRRLAERRFIRLLVAAALIASCLALWALRAWGLTDRLRYAWWERQCLRHVTSPGTIAFTDDPDEASFCLAQRDYQPPQRPLFELPASDPWVKKWKTPAFYNPLAARRLPLPSPLRTSQKLSGVAFLHGRRVNGSERLVAVCFDTTAYGPAGVDVGLYAFTLVPSGLFQHQKAPRCRLSSAPFLFVATPTKGRFRLEVGSPDPLDDSHFTIPYHYGDQSGLIDGWLRADPGGRATDFHVDLDIPNPLLEKIAASRNEVLPPISP